ncbi:MAG: DUF5710 domain-containing protein [Alphaproteobacteria bacterium]|nr:DUF5710 domain-containing protein [Alphaproteobacteria bacterium]
MNDAKEIFEEPKDKLILLNCEYAERAKVKQLGAKWHKVWRMWYITQNQEKVLFKRWLFDA